MLTNTLSPTLVEIPRPGGMDLDTFEPAGKPRILIVDDDPEFVTMLKIILRQAGFDVSGVPDHRSALAKCMELKPDAILLDLMMPEMDGYSVFTVLRHVTSAPVIFVSAASRPDNLFRALEQGADDYISKPFDNSELIARLKRTLRQPGLAPAQNIYYFPAVGLRLDLDAREVSLRGQPVRLLPREFSLLQVLAEHAPHNVPYEKITLSLWGQDSPRKRAHLKTLAFALRRKLEDDPARPGMVVNNRSVGYQLVTRS
jgi:two-component system, OmpR family, KDP operon response regulator KdpE